MGVFFWVVNPYLMINTNIFSCCEEWCDERMCIIMDRFLIICVKIYSSVYDFKNYRIWLAFIFRDILLKFFLIENCCLRYVK